MGIRVEIKMPEKDKEKRRKEKLKKMGKDPKTIKELEKTLKNWILRLNVQWKSYEWIDSSVDYKSVVETVLYLLTDKEYKILKDG